MEQLLGFVAQGACGLVCKLHRSTYGLKCVLMLGLTNFATLYNLVGWNTVN